MQMRLNSGGIDYIMAENTIENGELYPINSNISTESGDISQHNKKHILFIFFQSNHASHCLYFYQPQHKNTNLQLPLHQLKPILF